MKKLLLASLLVLGCAASAEARVNVDVGVGLPGVVYAPAPVYAPPPPPVYYEPRPVYYGTYPIYYRDGYYRHREYDWGYWHGHPGYYR